ncbi:tetraspanin-9-like [Amphibalanus amphitrite]|uniref:tetraspanin-9-like n=1 Tax=Amphibalanus amphitrite TaxID=1232801 RepID=UPI001C909844|nr:tetraspanin-9-like [Amphibalanus amphitrite]
MGSNSYRVGGGCSPGSALRCGRKSRFGWMQHVITVLAFVLFVVGCTMIGYMGWVLSTSVTVARFMSGELIFTYVVISLGFVYFFSGLVGWVSSFSENYCLLRLFMSLVLLLVIGQVGGLITLYAMQFKLYDMLRVSWNEINQDTRNFVQKSLECCGFTGPKEFAYTDSLLDSTCYEETPPEGVYTSETRSVQELRQDGCGPLLQSWLETNKVTWVPALACLAGLQILTLCITIYVIKRKRKSHRGSRSSSTRQLHDYIE